MDQLDIDRIRKLEKQAQTDPKAAALMRRRLKRRLDRLKDERNRHR